VGGKDVGVLSVKGWGIIMRWALVLGLSGLLVGCAAAGVKVSEQQAEIIQGWHLNLQ
jgi:hypothetical protein